MPKKVYLIENLDCANCAAKIEAKFNAHKKVQEAAKHVLRCVMDLKA